MRILASTIRGAGHLAPLLPVLAAAARAGHDVVVAAPASMRGAVEAAGFVHHPVAEPEGSAVRAVTARAAAAGTADEAHEIVIREGFALLAAETARAALTGAVETWRPGLILRAGPEFAAARIAERYDLPVVRVATSLVATEALRLAWAAPIVDVEPLRRSPLITGAPAALEVPGLREPAPVLRHHQAVAEPARSGDVVVGQGGFASVVAALAAGRPLVLMPRSGDEPLNARRVADLGAGLVAGASGPADAVAHVLRTSTYALRAAAVAEAHALAPAPADVLDEVLNTLVGVPA